jgi:hypothetical protein
MFSIRKVPGQGVGTVALQDIQTGQRILHEPVYSIGLLMAGIL